MWHLDCLEFAFRSKHNICKITPYRPKNAILQLARECLFFYILITNNCFNTPKGGVHKEKFSLDAHF